MINYEAAAIALFRVDCERLIIGGEFNNLADHVKAAYREKAKRAVDAALTYPQVV